MTWVQVCLILLAISWTAIFLVWASDRPATEDGSSAVLWAGWASGIWAMLVAGNALWGWT